MKNNPMRKKHKKNKFFKILVLEIFLIFTAITSVAFTILNKNPQEQKQTDNRIENVKKDNEENTPKDKHTKTITEKAEQKFKENKEKTENKPKTTPKKDTKLEEKEHYKEDEHYKIEKESGRKQSNKITNNDKTKNKDKKDKEEEDKSKKYKDEEDKDKKDKDKENKNENNLKVLASYTTKLETELEREENRIFNIKTAVKLIDGIRIKAGKNFSFYDIIWAGGNNKKYKEATTISQNGMDRGVGGGVCQVSSNLFVTALKAGMQIVRRESHSRIVNYVPLGWDSSFLTDEKNNPIKNLVFKNNTDDDILIKASCDNNTVTTQILGIDDGYEVTINPAKKIYETKKELEVEVSVETKYKGKTIKKQIYKSRYNKEPITFKKQKN